VKKRPDGLPVVMQAEGLEVRSEQFGDMRFTQYTLPAGFDMSPYFEGLPDDACPCPHWGRVVEGEITLRYTDGTEEVTRAGEFYHWPAGHTGWTETGVVFMDFCPETEARRVDEHVAAKSGG
jgi:hypothetical protein